MKQGTGPMVAVFVGVLAVAGGLAWLLYSMGEVPPEDPAHPGAPPGRPHEARPVPVAGDPARARPPKPPAKGSGPRFELPGHEDDKRLDWKEIGAAFSALMKARREIVELGPGALTPDERRERMMKVMMRFQEAISGPPPGQDEAAPPPLRLDHPAFWSNVVAAILENEKLPLTDAQSRRMLDLALARAPFADANVLRPGEDDGSWLLEKSAARARSADEFFAEVYAMLTPAQANALTPTDCRDRLRLDMTSGTPLWGSMIVPVPFTNESDFAETVTTQLAMHLQVTERRDELRAIVETWVRDLVVPSSDGYDQLACFRTSRVAEQVRRTVALLQRIAEEMKLPPEGVDLARKWQVAWVPFRK